MTKALQLPYRREDAEQVGKNLFRKQILPVGSIQHANGTLKVTPEYLADLARSFNSGAFDQVAFQLANDRNEHTLDPEKYRGEVKGVEVGEDGLYGLIDLTDEGAEVVAKNPKLGVSARIVKAKADGKDAIQHVLGTLDPRAQGMKPWEEVNLSDDDAEVVDLTSAEYSAEVEREVKTTEPEKAKGLIRRLLARTQDKDELSDEEAEVALAEVLREEEPNDPKAVELSEADRQRIEAAEKRAADAERRATATETRLANERFEREEKDLTEAGVPPAVITLAEPLLRSGDGVIELSNGTKADPGEIARKILDEFKGMVDLSVIGRDGGAEGSEESEAREKAKAWRASSS